VTPAARLTAARLAAGLSQYELARRIATATGGSHHAARNALARWETGQRVPEPESLAVWAAALEVEVPQDEAHEVASAAADLVAGLGDDDVPEGKRWALRRLRAALGAR
jgi:transcriptional regulator with XRE-family HTH domain